MFAVLRTTDDIHSSNSEGNVLLSTM